MPRGGKTGSVRRERELCPSSEINQEITGSWGGACARVQGSILSQTRNLAERWQLGESLTKVRRKRSSWLGMAQGFLPQGNICKTLCHLVSAGGKHPAMPEPEPGQSGHWGFVLRHPPQPLSGDAALHRNAALLHPSRACQEQQS